MIAVLKGASSSHSISLSPSSLTPPSPSLPLPPYPPRLPSLPLPLSPSRTPSLYADLETETNFAAHIAELEWNKLQIWTSLDEHSTNERNSYLLNAVRICAEYRIDIKAFTGNKHA